MSATRHIPIFFVPGQLAVNEAQAHEILGLNDGRSERAKKKAFYRICAEHEIKPLPGRVFPLKKLEAICAA
jgi:hypothetical protein